MITPYQIQIVSLIGDGLDSYQIADKLNKSRGAITKQRSYIIENLGAANMYEVIKRCTKEGII